MSVVKLLYEALHTFYRQLHNLIQQCYFQGNTLCNMSQNVFAFLNNVHLKINFNE